MVFSFQVVTYYILKWCKVLTDLIFIEPIGLILQDYGNYLMAISYCKHDYFLCQNNFSYLIIFILPLNQVSFSMGKRVVLRE